MEAIHVISVTLLGISFVAFMGVGFLQYRTSDKIIEHVHAVSPQTWQAIGRPDGYIKSFAGARQPRFWGLLGRYDTARAMKLLLKSPPEWTTRDEVFRKLSARDKRLQRIAAILWTVVFLAFVGTVASAAIRP